MSPHEIQHFESAGGGQIYQIPLEAFPGMWGYAYLVFSGEYRVLIDTGSGFGRSNEHLEAGVAAAGALAREQEPSLPVPFNFSDLTHILITHGHIDHFGGLGYVLPRTRARLGVHELDRRVLTNYEERLNLTGRRLWGYLIEAGLPPEGVERLQAMHKINKELFKSVKVDFTYEAVGMRLGPLKMLHVPGHCPGHVAIRLDDILFSGDHVLEDTSPHQAPERLTLSTGLDHYFHSLNDLVAWAGDVRLTLGGHKAPITDLAGRVREIIQLHKDRLELVREILSEPHTIADVSAKLFGEVHGYNELLAIEETGAHVEYLYQRGLLEIVNHEELARCSGQLPLIYQQVS